MLNRYKQIRKLFSANYGNLRKEVEDLLDKAQTTTEGLTLGGYKVIAIDHHDSNPFRSALINSTPAGVGVLNAGEVAPDIEEGFLEALGVKLGEKFIFIFKKSLLTTKQVDTTKFLLTHEYAHLLLNHLETTKKEEFYHESSKREYEADFLAAEITGLPFPTFLLDLLTISLKITRGSGDVNGLAKNFVGKRQLRNRLFNFQTNFSYR